ncbi:MAG: Phenol hydroxylase P5 protein [Syntrophorhabdaceae bacterium PtaU1.Bin034]|jgi:uncharacterized 2Fe-2S/4Fe-4S cluster protein (DUF4445 family)|nr:MAG: Phenol hydroxylase P5 protein [Syntrophorhabdaceae bacterium PtaU1.Bin034]
MPNATFLPGNHTAEIEAGSTLLEAARKAGAVVESPCNGTGKCGKCKVRLKDHASVMGIADQRGVSDDEKRSGIVLACQTRVNGDTVVELLRAKQQESVRVLEKGASASITINPFIKKEFLAKEQRTAVHAGAYLLGLEKGDTRRKNYGAVVDIGTTTLVATLVDLNEGREIASASSLNPQSLHGQDVLSRIKLASTKDGLSLLYGLFVAETNRLIGELTEKSGIGRKNIYELVYSGNTCMLHLATNTDPSALGRYPYTPALWGSDYLAASHHPGLHIADFGIIYLPPVISGFVGADITSGVLATRLHEKKGITLFIDIGTNGEMVIAKNGRLTASSTAAGPAFEGMNITFGMRAGNGAIESFEVDASGSMHMGTIGDIRPTGICGSGLLDVVAALVVCGAIDKNGRLVNLNHGALPRPVAARLFKEQGKLRFSLSETVYLSQGDIRQVQLAKGAIRTGIEFLLRHVGVGPSAVDEILIAGAFGYHLREKNLIAIGLLPPEFEGKIKFVGNTSRTGAIAFLLNESYRGEIEEVVKHIETIELANYEDFDRTFVNFLRF